MSKFWETPEFKKLNKQWRKVLKKTGFDDAEQEDEKLKFWADSYFKRHYNPVLDNAKIEYYRMAGYLLNEHTFDNEAEKEIWALHITGLGVDPLVKVLKKRGFKVHKYSTHEIIQKLRKIMQEKYLNEVRRDE